MEPPPWLMSSILRGGVALPLNATKASSGFPLCAFSWSIALFVDGNTSAAHAQQPHWRESGARRISAPSAGFLSVGDFAAHERIFCRHFKRIFSEAYREFESPVVRQ